MADFHQTGAITTLHRLGAPNLKRLEAELLDFSDERPVALVLPCLYSEIHGPALKGIVDQLANVPYLAQVVVSLSGEADRSLDVACGPGFLTLAFAKRCAEATGFDATDAFLTLARAEAKERGLANVVFEHGDGSSTRAGKVLFPATVI